MPEIHPGIPASQWRLSAEGRSRCLSLAEQLVACQPQALFSSLEPKAIETVQILSGRLSIPFTSVANLHEHERPVLERLEQPDFEASLARFFARPDELVFGAETATQAQQRFSTAVHDLLARRPGQTLAIVTHGTVMTLFVARYNPIAPSPSGKVSPCLPS